MLWKFVLKVIAVLSTSVFGVRCTKDIADDEYYTLFPRLFHLDDYDSCMLKKNALYCLGEFQIVDDGTNPVLGLIKTYSEDVHNFNRTLLHRGYCVSERCPSSPDTNTFTQCSHHHQEIFNHSIPLIREICNLQSKSSNTSSSCNCGSVKTVQKKNNAVRFEKCVSKYAEKLNLSVYLSSLQYCHTKEDMRKEWKVDATHWAFLGFIGLIIVVNIMGTVYDEMKSGEKSRLWTCWSIRRNWQHLIGPFAEDDPRLATLLPTEGCRVLLLLLVMFTHSGCIHDQLYLGNPRLVERMSHHPIMKLLHNGHSVIQMFILLSSFLLAQGVLQASRKPSFWILPKYLLKRIVRIAPVYLGVLGYAATWWPLTRDGPLWAPLVRAESDACRNKFFALAFFLGNFVRDHETCLVQTWYLQVEMQLYIFGLVLTLALSRVRRWALHILSCLFLVSCVGAVALAYVNEWTPLMMVAGPESVRKLFSNVEPFRAFYTKPWASISSCLVGLFLAHLHQTLQDNGFDPKQHKRLILCCQLVLPFFPCWTGGMGHLFRDMGSRLARAVFIALERPGMSILTAIVMFGAYNGRTAARIDKSTVTVSALANKGFIKHLFCWRGWYPLGRMSLAVLMMHWIVNKTFAASRHGLYYTSAMQMTVDFLATACFSYILALPVTLLLDIPMQQFYRTLTS